MVYVSPLEVVVLVFSSDDHLEYHFCKLKLPFLNNSSHFCLKISTSPTVLPPDVKSSIYMSSDIFAITLG